MKYRISIIIPTYKRKKYLLNLLYSLVNEVGKDIEITVVEQMQNHGNEFIRKANELKINLKYIFLDKVSTPYAKNVGAEHAKGDYLIFLDDDVLVHKGFMKGYIEGFVKDKLDVIAGKAIVRGRKINPNSMTVGKVSYWGKFSDDFSSDIQQEVDTVIGCNAGWKKSVFMNVGGFDEQITMNGIREETDLCFRAKKLGYKIIYKPRAAVTHVIAKSGGARKTEGRLWWYFNFFSNETYFFLKYRPKWVVVIILLSRWEWALRCMFGFGREVSLRSLSTPFAGILDGYKKYRRWKNENRS